MGWGETKVDHSGGPGLPSVDLLAISQLFLKDIGGTAKDMKVVKISEGPSGSAPNIVGAESCFRVGKVIPEPDCMGNCHWPEGGIRHRGPVDCCMKHHCPGQGHDSLYSSFSSPILVVTASSRVPDGLAKLGQMGKEAPGGECRAIVSLVGLGDDS